jgi:hypothetical protein
MIYLSRYYTKAEEKRSDFTEKVALRIALKYGEVGGVIDINNITPEEEKALQQLKAGSYFETYKGINRKIIDERHKAQQVFDKYIDSGNKQARSEALSTLKWRLAYVLIIIAFLALLYYGYKTSQNNNPY